MAYSIDFRQKALDHYEQHGNISQTARTFRITNRTLYQWIALKKETGSLQHRTKGGNSERIDKEELRRYVAEHPDAYQYEIAQHLGCTASNVGYKYPTYAPAVHSKQPESRPCRYFCKQKRQPENFSGCLLP